MIQYCTLSKRVYNMLSISNSGTNTCKHMGHKEILGNVRYIYCLECSDGIMGACLRPNIKLHILNTFVSCVSTIL